MENVLGIDDILTLAEACQRLRCSKQRVYRLVKSGKLGVLRDGRRFLFTPAILQAYFDSIKKCADQKTA